MKIKKYISILLVFASLFTLLTACGSKEDGDASENDGKQNQASDNALLPYGLEFGMSYEQAQDTCEGFPSISKASSNEGYASDGCYDPSIDDYCAMFGIDSDTLYEDMTNGEAVVFDPGYYFSFNADKELYEFYSITKILDGEGTAEYVFNAYLDYFAEKLGVEADMNESETKLAGTFETETLGVSVVMEVDGSTFMVYFVIHSMEYDLNG